MILDMALLFTKHATDKMIELNITADEVAAAVASGEAIEVYSESRLLNAKISARWIHVVAKRLASGDELIITTYLPEADKFTNDFSVRVPKGER
jgi:hypothetical protein